VETLEPAKLEYLFNLCGVWAFGGVLTEKDKKDYRKEFSSFWRAEFKHIKFPSKGTVFDYFVAFEESSSGLRSGRPSSSRSSTTRPCPCRAVTVPIPETVSIQQLSASTSSSTARRCCTSATPGAARPS
jgi:dynein heavy chain